MKTTLSIVVITMNRAEQLRSALFSCLNSKLPEDTEFIIVDNASTDNTKEIVQSVFAETNYQLIYEKESVNLGVGGGRNRGFNLARGEFVYFLDDDAVISPDSYTSFFQLPLAMFQQNAYVASITTRIYDELLGGDRSVHLSKANRCNSVQEVLMYLGGSHFLRKSYYEIPLYHDFRYGMEELIPSIIAIDKGFKNCYMPQIMIIHQPKRNKWNSDKRERNDIIISYNVNSYISKRLIYPTLFHPLLAIAFYSRTFLSFRLNVAMWKASIGRLKEQRRAINMINNKVKPSTVFSIIKDYSFGAAF